MVGESLKGEQNMKRIFFNGLNVGKDHRVMPLLYALAVYAVSETDIEQIDLPETDKAIIKKVSPHC